ncbi:ferrous iron transport protein A [Anoxybacillus pushchinoensis]|jgi:ferrous iron transport protein A|uniref:Ferrous iron transport protein A n=2 Tax=Anoxybacillus pushchinoensis TaxID=150248 RepID=A0A1I0U305_9BACL|nr:ferrous iron transport protein A [Anoxybacillus pushchinoensis]
MMDSTKLVPLSNCSPGQKFKIVQLELIGTMRYRLLDLGFVPGAVISVQQKSPLGDPTAFRVNNTMIALREEESSKIFGEVIEND